MVGFSAAILEGSKEVAKQTVKEVGKKVIKEAGKEIGKQGVKEVAKNSDNDAAKKISKINIHERIDTSKTIVKMSSSGVDISKRIPSTEVKSKDRKPELKEKVTEVLEGANQTLENDRHPITGVPFVRETIDLGHKFVEGVFPVFDSIFKTTLPEDYYYATDEKQFKYCTEQLKNRIEKNPELSKQFTPRQLEQIKNGEPRISGYTWHHNQKVGVMELVDADVHAKTGHIGGRTVWGGGTENR